MLGSLIDSFRTNHLSVKCEAKLPIPKMTFYRESELEFLIFQLKRYKYYVIQYPQNSKLS